MKYDKLLTPAKHLSAGGIGELLMSLPKDEKILITISNEEEAKRTLQNSAFHGIIQELFVSGMHSSNAETFADLKEYIKAEVVCLYEIVNIWNPITKKFEKRQRAKSVAKYTKKEMMQAITNLLAYVDNCGCNTKKMESIRAEMEARR